MIATSSIPEYDYRVRHPIVLAEKPHTLDIFVKPTTGHFDRRSAAQLREFAGLYRNLGRGPITIMAPVGPAGRPPIEPVRGALFRAGAHVRTIVERYPASPYLATPVRVSFVGLKAEVADRCGQWPRDLAVGSGAPVDWSNKPYWNFGCAYQSAFAAQVADPRDLVAPQAEAPTDTAMRTRAIESLRFGQDPSTYWRLVNSSISTVGGLY